MLTTLFNQRSSSYSAELFSARKASFGLLSSGEPIDCLSGQDIPGGATLLRGEFLIQDRDWALDARIVQFQLLRR